jgi:hypothetical protein
MDYPRGGGVYYSCSEREFAPGTVKGYTDLQPFENVCRCR